MVRCGEKISGLKLPNYTLRCESNRQFHRSSINQALVEKKKKRPSHRRSEPEVPTWLLGRGGRCDLLLAVDVAEAGDGDRGGGRGGEGEELLPPGPHGGGHGGVGGAEGVLLGLQALDLALLLRRPPPQRQERAQQQRADHLLPVLRQLPPDPAQRRLLLSSLSPASTA